MRYVFFEGKLYGTYDPNVQIHNPYSGDYSLPTGSWVYNKEHAYWYHLESPFSCKFVFSDEVPGWARALALVLT